MNGRRLGLVLLAALVLATAYLGRIGGWPLQDPDEGRYAEIPREMLESGDFVTPRLNYVDYFEKPPLLYWMVAASFRAFGLNEWAGRLPVALSSLATLAITFVLGWRMIGFRGSGLGTLLLATSPLFLGLSQVILIDPVLTTLVTGTLAAFWLACDATDPVVERRWATATAVLAALGVLAKGPVALVLPGGIALIELAWNRDFATLRALLRPGPVITFCALAVPWFAIVSWRNPHFARFFFVHEHFERFAGNVPGHHPASWLYYAPVLLLGTLPWPLLAAGLLASADGRAAYREVPAGARRFLVIWTAVIVVFFSVANSKLAAYVLPAFPAMALLLGGWVDRALERPRALRGALLAVALFGVLLGGVLLPAGTFAALLPGVVASWLGREAADVTTVAWAALGLGATLLAACATGWILVRRELAAPLVIVVLLAAGFGGGFVAATGARDVTKTSRRLAAAIIAERQPGDRVVLFLKFFQSLGFYLRDRVILVEGANEIRHGLAWAENPDAVFWPSRARLLEEWASGRRMFVVSNDDKLEEIAPLLRPPMRLVVKDDARVVVSNDPG